MKLLLVATIIFCGLAIGAAEQLVSTGEVFDLTGKVKLFNFYRYTSQQGSSTLMRGEFRDLAGQPVVEEAAELTNGKLKLFTINQKQTQQQGRIEVGPDQLKFSLETGGRRESKQESLPDNLIVGSTMVSFLLEHWPKLMMGGTVKVRFAVWDRLETVGFTFRRSEVLTENGQELVKIVMNPTNFLIRSLIDPVELTFARESRQLLTVKGRTTPKIRAGEEWKTLDALIKFTVYPQL